MDKYEYKVRADEIKSLIAEGNYEEAVKIADSIDWRRVKSVMMLCTISDLYKINRRYEDSRDILLLAYERHTGGRLIVYSLCELSIKLEDYVAAMEYYKEFVQLAPKDTGRYILQYKLYEANEVSLEERIAVLEEFKQKDYREKWAYELAYLYHRVGLASKCVEECDEIVLWFGEGRYVSQALELKQFHTTLTEEQQEKYDRMKMGLYTESDYEAEQNAIREEAETETEEEEDDEFSLQENLLTDPIQEIPEKEIDIQVKTVDVSQYNTINLQKELAESMKEFLGEEGSESPEIPLEEALAEELGQLSGEEVSEKELSPEEYGQAEEGIVEEEEKEDGPQILQIRQDTDEMQPLTEEDLSPSGAGYKQEKVSQEVFFGNTSEVNIEDVVSELVEKNAEVSRTGVYRNERTASPVSERSQSPQPAEKAAALASPDPSISNTGVIKAFHKPSGYDDILSQEYDGQISLVVPEEEKIEKQITGQLSIEDIMAEWERMKKENERKRMEEIRSRVHQQTNTLFADFDESTKSGLLEELEKVMVTAAMKEEKSKAASERPRVIKVSDIEAASAEKAAAQEKTAVPMQKKDTAAEEDLAEEAADNISAVEEAVTDETGVAEAGKAKAEEMAIEEETVDTEGTAEEATADAEAFAEEEAIADTEETAKEPAAAETAKGAAQEAVSPGKDTDSKYKAREMTPSEREQFAPFIHHRKTRRQIVEAIDNISMASFTGNVVISGEEGTGTTALAKLLVKEIQLADSNFSGKVAKISGTTMNKKDVAATLSKLSGGALIIEGAAAMKKATVDALIQDLNQEGKGIIILMEDSKEAIDRFLSKNTGLGPIFNLRVDVEALDDQTLVKYAKKYALEQEYAFDELGVLALHTRIADMQTSDHEVTLSEIEEMVDEAIYYADRKTPKHFFDILFGKRYDEEDMIILREKDFMHY